MIWLAFRRHRTNLIIASALAVALCAWMAFVVHGFETAPLKAMLEGGGTIGHYRDIYGGPAILRLDYQVEAINLLLLAFPCVLGILLGVPLVAAELDDHTNRVAWTQCISRTRWLSTKWWVIGVPLVILSTLVVLATQWWTHHVVVSGLSSLFSIGYFPGSSPVRPEVFSITGVVPVAYTLFALALGTAFGALVRRVSWAIVGTVLTYAVVALVMVTTVRPDLASKTFLAYTMNSDSSSTPLVLVRGGAPWFVGDGYRFVPGSHHPADQSAAEVGKLCENLQAGYFACISHHDLQTGQFFQPASNYWALQWRESGLYVLASAFLLLLGLWLVRRWRG